MTSVHFIFLTREYIMMKRLLFSLIMLLFFLLEPVYSQNDTIDSPLIAVDTLKQDFGLFSNDEVLNLSLRFEIVYDLLNGCNKF